MAIFMNSRKFFLVASSELLSGEFRGNGAWRDHRAADILGMQFHPEPFSQGAARGLGRAINRSTRSEHFDPENGSDVNDVTALLLLHVRQGSGNSIEKPFDIDINLPVPFFYLKGLDRRDGHDTGVIEEHIDAAETVDGPLMSASTSARFVTSVANPMALPPVAEIS